MFLGEFEHNLDPKGRIIIPAKFRAGLAEGMVITRGLDACLWVFPMDQWTELADGIASHPPTKKPARNFARLMFSNAAEATPDGQGRVLIPTNLRRYAGLSTEDGEPCEAVVIGLYKRIEIWNREHWQAMSETLEAEAENIADHLEGLAV
jgi:MraZ protein